MSELAKAITIRVTAEELRRLRARVRAGKTTPSAIVRRLLEHDLGEAVEHGPTLGELRRSWVGSVSHAQVPHGRSTRKALAPWNPDRRC
jgi:tRNA U55 pseudouridine synthase TruB